MAKLPAKIKKAAEEAELSTGGALIPEGIYKATCFEIDTAAVSKAKNPMWVFKFNEFTSLLPDDDEKVARGELWEHCALTEEAAWKLKQVIVSMGFEVDSDSDELIGEPVGVVIVHAPDNNDKIRANAAWYFDLDETEEQLANAG